MSETVVLDCELNQPVERVWHALTDPAMLSKWMWFETTDFQPIVGHRFQFRGKAETGWTQEINCEVLEADEPHCLAYTWVTEGWSGGLSSTTVVWTLTTSEAGTTHLHLEQSGFATEATRETAGAKLGWDKQLQHLRTLVAS